MGQAMARGKAKQAKKGKRKARGSGNPAKRTAAVAAPEATEAVNPGAAFGFDADQLAADLEEAGPKAQFSLPPQMQEMLRQQNQGPRR
jgi:hypothetical protein